MTNTLPSPIGGTEILYHQLNSLINLDNVNLIKSFCAFELLSNTKPNILWQHLDIDQAAVQQIGNPAFVDSLDAIVFVSHWQHEQYRKKWNLPGDKCFVIQNAINPIKIHKKPNKIKLIYTSMPNRGLELLLDSYKLLTNKVSCVVYSGTSIYGPKYHKQESKNYTALYKRMKALGIKHIEYATNDEIYQDLENSHILAYPSIFQETSCLSAIQALAAGCKVVTTNFGALPETCGSWADYVLLGDRKDFVKRYAAALDAAIEEYKYNEDQVNYYNKYWTWDYRINQWSKFLQRF